MIRKVICLAMILILSNIITVAADTFSYIYIQGDKITPFYVKADGKMAARYGKNYCIIPLLKPGVHQVEILFQQNIFPPKRFTIDVPADGCRGFLLDRQETGYELYDLENKTYLKGKN